MNGTLSISVIFVFERGTRNAAEGTTDSNISPEEGRQWGMYIFAPNALKMMLEDYKNMTDLAGPTVNRKARVHRSFVFESS